MIKKVLLIVLALALILSAGLVGCTTPAGEQEEEEEEEEEEGPQYGGILIVSDNGEGTNIGFPAKLAGALGNRQVAPALETLIRHDDAGMEIPWLATEFETDVTAKTITLTLREGVKFHDGTPFNAEAVKWNLDQCIAAGTAGSSSFESIEVINDYTVRINLTGWDSTVLSNLTGPLGMMISPTAYAENGEEWCLNNPVGTGPFKFVSLEKDVYTKFEKFDDYWQEGKPYLDGIEMRPVTDALTREMSLRAGELDVILYMGPEATLGLADDGYPTTRRNIGAGARYLVPSSANPDSPWAKVEVRQAAQYAVDTQAIVDGLFYGEYDAANQWIYEGHWGYNPSVVGYPYNPTEAINLLSDAGYPDGFDTTLIHYASSEHEMVFTAVASYLEEVGIRCELEAAQRARWTGLTSGGETWEGLLMGSGSMNPDIVASMQLKLGNGGQHMSMIRPDDYMEALDGAVAASDFSTKQQLAQDAMKMLIDDYALILTFFSMSEGACSQSNVHDHGFLSSPNTGLWTPEDCWLET